jgi:hypothetical protein
MSQPLPNNAGKKTIRRERDRDQGAECEHLARLDDALHRETPAAATCLPATQSSGVLSSSRLIAFATIKTFENGIFAFVLRPHQRSRIAMTCNLPLTQERCL